MKKYFLFSFIGIGLFISSCKEEIPDFPKYGRTEVVKGDTIFHAIPDFKFYDQDSNAVTNETYAEHVYVTDFFFTYCPSICPKVTTEMLRIYDEFKEVERVKLVSHTMDPEHDNASVLKLYADNLGVDSDKWHFLTGDQDELLDIAPEYFISAFKSPDAPGGFDHSGKLILIDEKRHVRAFCEGTEPVLILLTKI